MFPQARDAEKHTPIGRIDVQYVLGVIGFFFLESRTRVVRARICVMMVAKVRCHVVSVIAILD